MLVKFKTILEGEAAEEKYREKPSDLREVKSVAIEFCCDEMAQAFEESIIGFSDWHEHPQKDTHVNIYDQAYHTEAMHLKFCPFCGQKIRIENMETVQLVKGPERKMVDVRMVRDYLEKPVMKEK